MIRSSPSCGPGLLLAAAACLPAASHANGVDPEQLGLHWAWAENAGWIDAQSAEQPGAGLRLIDGVLSGWLWSPSVGWISVSCANTGSCDSTAYGLRLAPDPDASGFLRVMGTAWSANAGWIVAHCAERASCVEVDYGLRVHIETGLVEGHAWAENLGWISVSCGSDASCAEVDFGLQFDPEALLPPEAVFRDGFES